MCILIKKLTYSSAVAVCVVCRAVDVVQLDCRLNCRVFSHKSDASQLVVHCFYDCNNCYWSRSNMDSRSHWPTYYGNQLLICRLECMVVASYECCL